MVCFTPMIASWAQAKSEAGKRGVTFNTRKALVEGWLMHLPCGNCVGCRMDRCQAWGIRCTHEAQMHSASCFLTLTYGPEHLPPDNSVRVDVMQGFIRELRRQLRKLGAPPIRFLACGEYGDKYGRAHYHAIIFGFDFPDRVPFFRSSRGDQFFRSDLLDRIWGKGHALIGGVTFESARYVASYAMKAVRGDAASDHYDRQHPETGEFFQVEPEFATMSLKPGIGEAWLKRFKSDVYPADEVIIGGRAMKPPRYYDQQLAADELEALKALRRRKSIASGHDRTKERMRARHQLRVLCRKFYLRVSGGL